MVSTIRLATWNLLHGMSVADGQVRPADLGAGAQALDADVLALQEVDWNQRRSGDVDQTTIIAEATGAVWHRFVPSVRGVPGEQWEPAAHDEDLTGDRHDRDGDVIPGHYGIALASRLPVLEWEVKRFAPAPWSLPLLVPGTGLVRVPDEPRLAIVAVVAGPTGPFTVAATHLSFVPGYNVSQLRALRRWLQTKPGPRVLLGDLNLPRSLVRLVGGLNVLAGTATYPSWSPRVQFDHVLADGITERQVERSQAVRTPVSDHCALLADIRL